MDAPLAQAIGDLAGKGLLGICLVISLFVIRHLYQKNQELHEKRLGDVKEFSVQYQKALEENTHTVEALARQIEEADRGP